MYLSRHLLWQHLTSDNRNQHLEMCLMNKTDGSQSRSQLNIKKRMTQVVTKVSLTEIAIQLLIVTLCVMVCPSRTRIHEAIGSSSHNVMKPAAR